MGSPAFVPPPLSTYQGPVAKTDTFNPPPLSSYSGPASGFTPPPNSSGDDDARQERLAATEPATKGSPEWATWRNQRNQDLNSAFQKPHPDPDHPDSVIGGISEGLSGIGDLIKQVTLGPNPETGKPGGPIQGLSNIASSIVDSHVKEGQKALESTDGSQYGHALATAVPLFGPAAAEIGELYANGQPRRATGKLIALIGSLGLPALAKTLPSDIPITPALRNPNPAVADAVDFGLKNNVPVDAGTATGNPAIKVVQHLADRSIGGSFVASKANQVASDALKRTGRDLAASISPTASVPEQAGASVRTAIKSASDAAASRARAAYSELERIENDPVNKQMVQVGTKPNHSTDPTAPDRIPDMQDVQLPVDMRPVKTALRPVYDDLSDRLSPGELDSNKAYTAIKTILRRPDHIPASVADKDLGYLKGIARDATRDQVRHFAGTAIDALEQQVQNTVSGAGSNAVSALSRGRAATMTKYAAREVLDNLREEPVQAFHQAVWKNDTGISQLRAMQQFAPQEMTKIGRAYIDDLIDQASHEGDFGKRQAIFTKWSDLGPQTKKILFQDQAKIKALDDFFLLAKKMAENPNPSGTGHIISMLGQGELMWNAPHIGVPIQISAAMVSKLMRSAAGVRALTDGLRIPLTATADAAAATGRLLGVLAANKDVAEQARQKKQTDQK